MNRREILLGTGLALSTSVAGCVGDGTPASSSNPDGSTSDGTSDDGETTDDTDPTDDEPRSGDEPDDADSQSDETDGANECEHPRVDEPPHPIERPDHSDGWTDCEWNDDYLGEHMETAPSLSFEVVTRRQVADAGLEYGGGGASNYWGEYWVELVTDESERDEVFDLEAVDEETRAALEAVDFEESVLVAVQSGWDANIIEHRWARVEESADGLHLHGYNSQPFFQDDALTWRTSVLEVERSDDASLARVSLTVSEDRRVHFDSTEGVVSLGD